MKLAHFEKAKRCRELLNLTPTAVSRLVNVTQPVYFRFEEGKTRSPKYLKKLAQVLQTTPEWLEYDVGDPPHYWEENAGSYGNGVIPLVDWQIIPKICENPEILKEKGMKQPLDITFKNEKNLIAATVPDVIIPGQTDTYFKGGDILLISLTKKPVSKDRVIAYKDGWPNPYYVEYIIMGDKATVRHETFWRKEELIVGEENLKICGVIIARLNIYI